MSQLTIKLEAPNGHESTIYDGDNTGANLDEDFTVTEDNITVTGLTNVSVGRRFFITDSNTNVRAWCMHANFWRQLSNDTQTIRAYEPGGDRDDTQDITIPSTITGNPRGATSDGVNLYVLFRVSSSEQHIWRRAPDDMWTEIYMETDFVQLPSI